MMKKCPKCERILDDIEFHKNRTRVDGLQIYCKVCKKNADSKYYTSNRNFILESVRKYRKNNRGSISKKQRKYRLENKESIAKQQHSWYVENRERILDCTTKYNVENREKVREYKRKWRKENPDKRRAHKFVHDAIVNNILPSAWSLVCEHCGEDQAQCYHHDKGYEPENHLDVVALCNECHGITHRIYHELQGE